MNGFRLLLPLCALALSVESAAPRNAEALCALPQTLVHMIAPLPDAELDASGSIILARMSGWPGPGASERSWQPARLEFPAAQLVQNGRTIPLRSATLGDGIVQLTPTQPPTPGTWQLRGVQPNNIPLELRFRAGTHAPLAAPQVTAVRHTVRQVVEGRGRGSSDAVAATLQNNAPEQATAVLVYVNGSAQAATLRRVPRGANIVSLYASGRCGSDEVIGRAALPDGASVNLRFIDAQGTLSPASVPVVISN